MNHALRSIAAASIALAAATVPAADAQLSFGDPNGYADCTVSHYPTRVRLFDMDGDGKPDLVLPGRDRNNLLNWAPINADGTIGAIESLVVEGQTDDALSMDVDGDGKPELVLAIRAYAGRVQVLHRGADGRLVPYFSQGFDREPRSIVGGDFNGDGYPDLAVSFYGSDQLDILLNNPAATPPADDGSRPPFSFAVSQRIRLDAWSGGIAGPQDVLAGDLDGDGNTDLVVACIGTRRFDVLFGSANGTFRGPVSWLAPNFPGVDRPAVVGFALADIDGDGKLDIVAPLLSTTSQQPLVVFRNDGHGNFPNAVMVGQVPSGYHWACAAADLDGDGRMDVISGTALPGNIHAWRNLSSGGTIAFAAPVHLDYSSFPRDFLLANLDRDCDVDLVEADIGGHYVMSYPNLRGCGGSFGDGGGDPVPPMAPIGVSYGDSPASAMARRLAEFGPDPGTEPGGSSLTPPGACGPGGGGGRCDQVHANPGCFTTPCCEKVCGIDPDCCTLTWDRTCVDLAGSECRGLVCPSYGGCTEVHDKPGCSDPDCCNRVTPLDGYCQGATWDWVCVARAAALCGLPPVSVTIPAGARPNTEVCYKHLDDGPNWDGATSPIACGETVAGTCTTGSPRDTDWYALGGGAARRVRLTLDAEFPAEVHLVRGTFAGPLEQRSIDFGGRGVPFAVDACLDGGPWYAVVTLGMACGPIRDGEPCTIPDPAHPPPPDDPPVVPGYDGNAYWLRLECLSCGVFGDLNGDGRVDGSDLGLLLGQFGAAQPVVGDLNGDGRVDGGDLGLILGAWSVN